MPDSNGNGMHHTEDNGLFTESGPVLPTPGRGPVHDSALPLLLLLPTVAADWSMHGG